MNRPSLNRELEVRVMFEPNRFTDQSLSAAYQRVVLIRRRTTIKNGKEGTGKGKKARRAGGGL